jgi:putative DNA primase/helicase
MPQPSRLSAVCSYIGRGWPVFPCDKRKQPKVKHWRQDASLDVDYWRDYWVNNPDDCIGIVCGIASGIVVIDIDSYKDPDKARAFRELCATNGLPQTYSVATGSGGTHLYFRLPAGVVIRNSGNLVDLYGADVRGEGGYVLGAGSVTQAGEYTVKRESPLAELPAWLAGMLTAKTAQTPDTDDAEYTDDERRANDPTARKIMDKIVADELTPCVAAMVNGDWEGRYSGPHWDESVYRAACSLLEVVQSGWNTLGESDALSMLMRGAPRDAGFTDTQILDKWNSARKRVIGKTRPAPRNHRGEWQSFDTESFFGRGGLLVDVLVDALVHESWGEPFAVDTTELQSVWVYRHGVWTLDRNAVDWRVMHLLSNRYRPAHFAGALGPLKRRLVDAGHVLTADPLPDYVNVQNGMLNWRNDELLPHDPDWLSTIRLPVQYRLDATCPRFDKFVASAMAPDAVDFLWEIIGYMVMSGNPFQKAILLYGDGSNGKGTLIRVLRALLGDTNCSYATLSALTEDKFATAGLYGKLANLAGDIDPTYMRSTATFKAITGEDKIEGQRKYEHAFHFQCWAVPVFSANKLWRSVDNTTGYRRRWVIVPFPNHFDNTPTLTDQLTVPAELDGILAHAVRSLRTLMARGYFEPPLSAQLVAGEFATASDQVLEWLEDSDEIVLSKPGSTDEWTPSSHVYASYKRWAEGSGNRAVTAREFKSRLTAAGYISRKASVQRIYGLTIDALAGQSAAW